MKHPKLEPCIILSREALEATVADIVRLKLEHAEKTAAMEKEIAEVQKRHQEALLQTARQIETKEAGAYIYCQKNRATLFPEKKSLDQLLAVIGFELTPWRVEKRNSKDNEP
jgi:phage host-nuclease inhibitor protein Gam